MPKTANFSSRRLILKADHLSRSPQWLPRVGEDRPRTALLIVWFGANDAVLQGQLQRVPLDAYKRNLKAILDLVKDSASPYHSPTTELMLVTPPPIDPAAWLAELVRKGVDAVEADRTVENTRQYAEACKEVADAEGVPCVDAWTVINAEAERIGGSLEPFMYDGLHLNTDGYKIVSEGEYPSLVFESLLLHD